MKQAATLLAIAAFVAAVVIMESPSERAPERGKPCESTPTFTAGAGR